MHILRTVYSTILESLFPLSSTERELLSFTPKQALITLPKSPSLPISHSSAVFAYKDERVSKMIWNIKYKKSAHDVSLAGYALHEFLKGRIYSNPAMISTTSTVVPSIAAILIPLPNTPKRRRERGYNQCELIVDEILRVHNEEHILQDIRENNASINRITSGDSLLQTFIVNKTLLIRTQHTSHQKMKDRKGRLESAKGIFAVDEDRLKRALMIDPQFKTRPLIIIDDVVTTGSTMKEAMETLRVAGFTEARGLAIAH